MQELALGRFALSGLVRGGDARPHEGCRAWHRAVLWIGLTCSALALDDREAGGAAGALDRGGGVGGGNSELVATGLEPLGLGDAALEADGVRAATAAEGEGAGEHQPGALAGVAVLAGGRDALLLDPAAGLGREERKLYRGGAAEGEADLGAH